MLRANGKIFSLKIPSRLKPQQQQPPQQATLLKPPLVKKELAVLREKIVQDFTFEKLVFYFLAEKIFGRYFFLTCRSVAARFV